MYSVCISPCAERDLENIVSYIADKLAAPKAASDFVDAVYDCYDNLESSPYLYEACHDPMLQKEGYRRATIKNYVLVYNVDENSRAVMVHRFFYGRQDYVNLI